MRELRQMVAQVYLFESINSKIREYDEFSNTPLFTKIKSIISVNLLNFIHFVHTIFHRFLDSHLISIGLYPFKCHLFSSFLESHVTNLPRRSLNTLQKNRAVWWDTKHNFQRISFECECYQIAKRWRLSGIFIRILFWMYAILLPTDDFHEYILY